MEKSRRRRSVAQQTATITTVALLEHEIGRRLSTPTTSAEAEAIANRWVRPHVSPNMIESDAYSCAQDIDALIAQRVSAEAERWQNRDRQRLEQISTLQETVQSFQSARDERPAPERPQPSLSTLRPCCRTVCPEWPECGCGRPGASPAAVGDYTERARELLRRIGDAHGRETQSRYYEDNKPSVKLVIDAFAAVASERDAAAIRAFGQRVWSDTEEVAYQAGVSDTRARLREPDEELIEAAENAYRGDGWKSSMRAALTKIGEMLK